MDPDHGGVSYVFPRTTCYAKDRTRNVKSATPRQTVSTTVLVGGQEQEDDGVAQRPHVNLSASDAMII